MAGDAVAGADGLLRCPWGTVAGPMQDYHDHEWGTTVRTEQGLFERLTLEAFQSGLSWAIMLRKRARLREVFLGFDAAAVAQLGPAEVDVLLADPGIIRNRAKIQATINNAEVVGRLDVGLEDLLWSYAPDPPRPRPARLADVPSQTVASVAMSKDLRRRGFRFVGPTTAYALMQATGMVDDHLEDCHVAPPTRPPILDR